MSITWSRPWRWAAHQLARAGIARRQAVVYEGNAARVLEAGEDVPVGITLRECTAEDVAGRIRGPEQEEFLEDLACRRGRMFGAFAAEKLIAYVWVVTGQVRVPELERDFENPGIYIFRGHTDAAFRGQGIGRALIVHAVGRTAAGAATKTWSVTSLGNPQATRVFASIGVVPVRTIHFTRIGPWRRWHEAPCEGASV
jgi:ribosomal protein S18 acetylase RimI-like enzyme